MAMIRSLRPNVTRDEAIRQFSPGGLGDAIKCLAFGELRSIGDFYIPFQIFQVEITNAGTRDEKVLGLDRVSGSLDLYDFETMPSETEMVRVETRNFAESGLEISAANKKVIEKVQRVLFSRGFFRMRNLQIVAKAVDGDFYIPYWVGFRGRESMARITVIDAIRRKVEGAKVRHLLQNWLQSRENLA